MARPALLIAIAMIIAMVVVAQAQWHPQISLSIDCGSSSSGGGAASDAIQTTPWQGENSSSSFVKNGINISTDVQNPDLPSSIPYLSARVFTNDCSYQFPNIRGRYWLRLHFYPIPDPRFDPSTSNFTITIGTYQLFSGSVLQSIKISNKPYLVREFSLDSGTTGNGTTTVTIFFRPSPGSFAFVNGIQIMSSPADGLKDNALLVRSDNFRDNYQEMSGLEKLALQTMYRLNVGGSSVIPKNDEQGRSWNMDKEFIEGAATGASTADFSSDIKYPKDVPEYIAPASVYGTGRTMGVVNANLNISWRLKVDPGFYYFVRLHFAELIYTKTYQRVFNVYINNNTALDGFDILGVPVPEYTPLYKDFVINVVPGLTSMRLQMGPAPGFNPNREAILNGVEVFKMNNSAGSLSVRTEDLVPEGGTAGSGGKSSSIRIIGITVGGLAGLGVLVTLAVLCWCKTRTGKKKIMSPSWRPSQSQAGTSVVSLESVGRTSSAPPQSCRHFTLRQILDATNNFDDELLVGVGGFGKVYEGIVEGGLKVAIKRGNPRSEQGLNEFLTEIEMLSRLRHRHLVSLIGYCDENSEMILVYDYMANGPLRRHLYGTDARPLSWKMRLEICVGAARGLHYLHTGAARPIIHRDVKTTNILVDDGFVAKVADFGLSKVGPSIQHTHVSTAVKGSFGYLDPEYYRRQQLTEKSDVYSFGVVLLEVLCARPAINPALPREQVNIAEWAMHWQRLGMLGRIMDPKLAGDCTGESLGKFGEIAQTCLADRGSDRPTMGQVLWNLEYALQLHQASLIDNSSSLTRTSEVTPLRTFGSEEDQPQHRHPPVEYPDSSMGAISDSAVFSQFINPEGR